MGDAEGTVEDIGLAYTRLRTPDNRRVLIPNEELANSRVTNMTIIDPVSLAQVRLTLPPAADPARVRAILDEQAEAVAGRLLDRPGPGAAVADVRRRGHHVHASACGCRMRPRRPWPPRRCVSAASPGCTRRASSPRP